MVSPLSVVLLTEDNELFHHKTNGLCQPEQVSLARGDSVSVTAPLCGDKQPCRGPCSAASSSLPEAGQMQRDASPESR